VPGLSIFACLYLMNDLSSTTYHVFTVWMTVAMLLYFGYGIRHSRLNRVDAVRDELTTSS
jgi:APA family basic amino acid/polyamine antiporter